MSGDKGQAASLLGKPAILFDDKEENVCQVLQVDVRNAGCVVRVGTQAHRGVRRSILTPFSVSRNPSECFEMSKQFHDSVTRTAALEQHRNTGTTWRT